MSKTSETTTIAEAFLGMAAAFGIAFVALKLAGITEVATWSWWMVTLPFWILPATGVFITLGVTFIALSVIGFAMLCAWLSEVWFDFKRAP